MSKPTNVLEQMRRQRANTLFAGSDEAIVRRGLHDGVAHSDADPRLMHCPSVPGPASVLRLAMAAARTGDLT
jgi:hypothetical protein